MSPVKEMAIAACCTFSHKLLIDPFPGNKLNRHWNRREGTFALFLPSLTDSQRLNVTTTISFT